MKIATNINTEYHLISKEPMLTITGLILYSPITFLVINLSKIKVVNEMNNAMKNGNIHPSTTNVSPIIKLANFNIITFINLVEQDFEIDVAPDIFMENIESSQLGLLWNLSKENYAYSFQDAFFTNDFIDNQGNITSMIWRITFEKYNKNSDSNKK